MQIGGLEPQAFLIAMAAHVGLDPRQDIRWVISTDPSIKPLELFMEGKIDAFFATPPEPLLLRARGINHVIFNSALDPAVVGILLLRAGAGDRQFVHRTRWRLSACCAPFSRLRTSVPASRRELRESWWTVTSSIATILLCRPCNKSPR